MATGAGGSTASGRAQGEAPARPPAGARGGFIIFAVVALIAVGLIGAGLNTFRELEAGEAATATVRDCDVGRRTVRCTGTWTVGGSLLQGGRVERGPVEGASASDVGKQINVRVLNGSAYVNTLEQPSIMIGLGGVFLALAAFIGVGQLKTRRRALQPMS